MIEKTDPESKHSFGCFLLGVTTFDRISFSAGSLLRKIFSDAIVLGLVQYLECELDLSQLLVFQRLLQKSGKLTLYRDFQ